MVKLCESQGAGSVYGGGAEGGAGGGGLCPFHLNIRLFPEYACARVRGAATAQAPAVNRYNHR